MADQIIMNARKSLIIGLGSTGAMTCNQIIEKIMWTHGSMEYIPWVRTVVLETAILPVDTFVSQYSKYVHLRIHPADYADLIKNPQNYKDKLDFPSWNIPEITGTHSAIENGASNTRIMGRLAFLFNYEHVKNTIVGEIEKLNALSAQDASTSFSQAVDSEVSIVFNSNAIDVYVVGSLCGGTSSGSFIDLGYFLRFRQGYDLRSTGIFMLPSLQESNELFAINAYAALVELNHFSDDRSIYTVQYPDRPGSKSTAPRGMTPYMYTYLVQCRGADQSEYAKLITSTADYVYTDIIGSSGIVRDNRRDNIAQFFVQRDLWGATQKFMTFGLSSIEFPFAKVYKGCTLRLTSKGLSVFIGGNTLTEAQISQRFVNIMLTDKAKVVKYLTLYNDELLSNRIHRMLSDARLVFINTPSIVSDYYDQINAAFSGGTVPDSSKLSSRIIPQTIESNAVKMTPQVRNEVAEDLRGLVEECADNGIATLVDYIDRLVRQIEDVKNGFRSDVLASAIATLGDQYSNTYQRLMECDKDPLLKLFRQRDRVIQRYVDDTIEILNEYYKQKLTQCCAEYVRNTCESMLQYLRKVRMRITDSQIGMKVEMERLRDGIDALYQRTDVPTGTATDGWSRVINGTELFEVNSTILKEYELCIHQERERSAAIQSYSEFEKDIAHKAVMVYAKEALRDVLIDTARTSRYDDAHILPTVIDDNQLLSIARPANDGFKSFVKKA